MPVLPGWTTEEVFYIAERAYRLYSEGQLREAAILFEGLTVVDPENAYCRKVLAAIASGLDQHALAVRHMSAVLARDATDPDALAARCEALIATGDLAAARRDLEALAALPAARDHARRLRLRLRPPSEPAPGAPDRPQLLPGPPR